jgi:co-chaperonin GroES (HSP10)
MPLTREAIKHAPVSQEVWRTPRTGVLWFDPRQIKPLGDHILVELDEATDAPCTLVIPDIARNKDIGTRTGTVLAVGPGKWHEKHDQNGNLIRRRWRPTTLKRGDRVVIGHYSDWESWHCSVDGHQSRDRNIALCQEGDVRGVLG